MLKKGSGKATKAVIQPPKAARPSIPAQIHPTAQVDPKATIGSGVIIGPFAVIGPQVTLGDGVRVDTRALIDGVAEIGEDARIWPGAIVGIAPQDRKYKGATSKITIGPRAQIREYATLHRANYEGTATSIGADCLIMGTAHIAHDCIIGDGVIMGGGSMLAGHIRVDRQAFISGNSAIHQFSRIGRLAMVAGQTRVSRDVPPFFAVQGEAEIIGLNLVGLRRAKIPNSTIKEIKELYRILYHSGLTWQQAVGRVAEKATTPEGLELVHFLKEPTKRNYCRPSTK